MSLPRDTICEIAAAADDSTLGSLACTSREIYGVTLVERLKRELEKLRFRIFHEFFDDGIDSPVDIFIYSGDVQLEIALNYDCYWDLKKFDREKFAETQDFLLGLSVDECGHRIEVHICLSDEWITFEPAGSTGVKISSRYKDSIFQEIESIIKEFKKRL